MREGYREFIEEENKYYDLLKSNPKFKPQGCTKDFKKRVVGIIRGSLENYHPCDFLDYEYFDSWKDAYTQLVLNEVYCPNCKNLITPETTEYEECLEGFGNGKLCPICEEYIY